MNIEIESKFVKNFIVKSKQERIKFELNTPKKRSHCIYRFSHDTKDLIKEENIVFCGNKMTIEEAETEILKLSSSKICYYLSENQEESGYAPLHECLKKYYYNGPAIFICSENVVFIVTEYVGSGSEKFLLKSK